MCRFISLLLLGLVFVVTFANAQTIYFDLGTANYTVAGNWNTVTSYLPGVHVSNAIDNSGNATSVAYNCLDDFSFTSEGGDPGLTAYPLNAGIDSFYLRSTNSSATILIGGLTPGQAYDFTFFGSRNSSGPRALDISIGQESVYIDAAYNENNTVSINQVSPNASGIVTINVDLASNSSFGYLGVIEINGQFGQPEPVETGIFVAPGGSDTNPGTKAWPKATFYGAMEAVRDYMQSPGLPEGGLNVYFREGKYFINSMTQFSSADSGLPGKPVIYQSYPGEKARFIGGIELNNSDYTLVTSSDAVWSRVNDAAKGQLYKMDLSSYGISDYGAPLNYPVELSFNEQIMQLGRWPNVSYETTVSPTTDTSFTYTGTRPSNWLSAPDPFALGNFKNGYFCSIVAISSIDTGTKKITLAQNPLDRGIENNKAWCAFNLLEEIDTPGEYYIDRTNGILYFWPADDLSGSESLLSTFGGSGLYFAQFNGADYIHFKDLTFEMFRERTCKVSHADSITFDRCIFRNNGASALNFDNAENITIKNSRFYGLGGAGMTFNECGDKYSLTPSNNLITNNFFEGTGRWKNGLGYAPPVWIYSTNCGFTISHNHFQNTRCMGLIIFGGTLATVEYNRFHNCGYEADDTGANYNAGDWTRAQGGVWRYNEVYDSVNKNLPGDYGNHGVHGIYFDYYDSGATCYGNILHTIGDRVFISNGGRDLNYSNNVIVNAQKAYYSADWSIAGVPCQDLVNQLLDMDYNVPGSAWYNAFPHLLEIPSNCSDPTFDNYRHPLNCSIDTTITRNCPEFTSGSAISYYSVSGNNLTNTDPGFVDEENLVFALRDDSPAYTIPGFERIPWEQIGLLDLEKATRGIPLDGAVDQAQTVNLYWAPAFEAAYHKVYLSKYPDQVATRDAQTYLGQFTECNAQSIALSEGRTYYWAVDAYNSSGELIGSGDVWEFTVAGISADLNKDGYVNMKDLSALFGCWLEPVPAEGAGPCEAADIDSSSLIDLDDLHIFFMSWLVD